MSVCEFAAHAQRCAIIMVDERLKYQMIDAYDKCRNLSQVARQFNVDKRTVRLWVQRYAETGNVAVRPRMGRPPALNFKGAAMAKDLLTSGKFGSAQAVANELHRLGIPHGVTAVCTSTVARHAKAAASIDGKRIQYMRKFPAKRLTKRTQEQRLAYAEANQGRSWENVMFTDRCKLHFWFPGEHVHTNGQWVVQGELPQAYKVNNPSCVNIYAGITKKAVTKVHHVAGTSKMISKFKNKKGQPSKNITSSEYMHVLKKTLLPRGSAIFSAQGFSVWYLQQDNDPTHKKAAAQAIKEWNAANQYGIQVRLLPNYPPHSPDMNPIENLWAKVQKDVVAVGCKDFAQFKQKVTNLVEKADKKYLKALIGSLPTRINACIVAAGGKTKY